MSERKYRGVKYGEINRGRNSLKEVFGVTSSIPQFTYVDRAQLDKKFIYFVTNEKHIVIHGASKQGKTVLRKKNLESNLTIVVQCTSTSNLENIYTEIVRSLNIKIIKNQAQSITSEAQGKLGIVGGSLKANQTTDYSLIGNEVINIGFISEQIKLKKKKIIIEDFHYLPEEEKRKLAFDLKAFWDNSV